MGLQRRLNGAYTVGWVENFKKLIFDIADSNFNGTGYE